MLYFWFFYKNVESFIFVILYTFYCSNAWETRFEVEIAVAKCEALNWALNKIPWTIKNSKEFFKCFDVAAVYCTPVSFTGHCSSSRVWRIHETLVISTVTRKKLSSVMRPTPLKPKSKLNRWRDWKVICEDLLALVKSCCIQDSGRNNLILRLFGLHRI